MSLLVASQFIGPLTLEQTKFARFCERADCFNDLNPQLRRSVGVDTPSELVQHLRVAHAVLEQDRGEPYTRPANDSECSARRAVRVRSPYITGLIEDIEKTFGLELCQVRS